MRSTFTVTYFTTTDKQINDMFFEVIYSDNLLQ